MKLSEIIAYKNLLDVSTPLEGTPLAYERLNPILTSVKESSVQISNLTQQLETNYRYVLRTLEDFENTVEDIKIAVQEIIDNNSGTYYSESTKNYQQSLSHETTEYILDRKLPVYEEVIGQLVTRIRANNSFRYAGMILRPGHENWINELVGCDPLYLVDQSIDLLQPAVLRFNEQYQRRLRTYTIQESLDSPMFNQLPDGQFGFCLAYNFFNYKPIEVIEIYLKELYTKLKPGGVVGLTFNDCDRAEGTELFERHFMSFTPRRAVLSMVENLGYEIMQVFRTDQSCTWLEIKRPGVITSIRGGQSLAKVLYKSKELQYTTKQLEKINDKIDADQYTANDLENIKKLCLDLNIKTNEISTIGQIMEVIKQSIKVIDEVNYTSKELEKIMRTALDLNINIDDMHITRVVELIKQRKLK